MTAKTSAEIRSSLVDALQLDLVGPTSTNTEYATELLSQAPSKWYLTGFLAPFGAPPEARSDDTADDDIKELGQSEAGDDNQAPDTAPARKPLFPASMGLSFLVPKHAQSLKVTINWGDYHPVETVEESIEPAEPNPSKKKKSEKWQRIPQTASLEVPIASKKDTVKLDIPGGSGLALVVNCRPVHAASFETGTLSVSVFLVNYRQMHSAERDITFAFQTNLTVTCLEGFVPRPDMRGFDSNDWDEAVACLQYRHDYEFAVGHNVSAIALSIENDHCTAICTTWIPTAEVPKVEPATIEGVSLGMEALAKAESASEIRQMLGPIVTEYRTWITGQQSTSVEQSQVSTAQDLHTRAGEVCTRIKAGLDALDDPDVLEAFRIANRVIEIARRRQLSQEQNQPPESFDLPLGDPFKSHLFCST